MAEYAPLLQGETGTIANEARDAPRVLAALRESLGLSITGLARAFDVSRPTVYAWIKGETEPRSELWPRLQEMEQLASRAQRYSLSRPARLVRRPVLDGTSLLERLLAGQEMGRSTCRLWPIFPVTRRQSAQSPGVEQHALPRMWQRNTVARPDREVKGGLRAGTLSDDQVAATIDFTRCWASRSRKPGCRQASFRAV
ncbi:helix-turn-helix domain-containing protein [Thioalkalivibrio sp. AKL17]|uniref:helix-turn-helix domain-containing protein n=1 Tax=Thioalkalivibrio sp. AKL17 TaxID=1158160 RepID=UPI0035270FCF